LPAIRSIADFKLKALYSRSQKSAEKLAKAAGDGVQAFYETPASEDRNLDALLARSDIQAISIAVSISTGPEFIRKALQAGKSILSEKPIAPTVEIAQDLFALYQKQRQNHNILWAVGENFRFWKSFNRAASILQDLKANILTFRVSVYHFIGPDNEYFHSDW
jgi:predicted dehydrogenase